MTMITSTQSPEWVAYMRRLMNAPDSSPGHQIGMRVWELGGKREEVRDYLDEVIIDASYAKDDARLTVARKLKTLLAAVHECAEVS